MLLDLLLSQIGLRKVVAGIDMVTFSPHSTRASAASTALFAGTTVDAVMCHAGWKSASVFMTYYACRIQYDPHLPRVKASFFLSKKSSTDCSVSQ